MNFYTINPQSRYHPYGPKYLSTLTDRGYGRSKLSRSYSEPMEYTQGIVKAFKSEWNWVETRLTADQEAAYNKLVERVKLGQQFCTFLAGPAGTGKSVVLKKFANFIRCHHGFKESCTVTAPIGMAALNVDGVTLHSLLHLFPGAAPFARLTPEAVERLFQQLRRMKVLIIDEIGLVSSLLLAQIDFRLQEIFGCDKPFGGISVVVFGDLLQLPPVPNTDGLNPKDKRPEPDYIFSYIPDKYKAARDAATPKSPTRLWSLLELVELEKNIRAKNPREAKVLASIRMGNDEDEEEVRSYLVNKCKMVGASPEDFHRELRLLENEEPKKSFMILARTVKEVDAINTWRVENSSKTVVLPAMGISPLQTISGYKLKSKERQDLKLIVGGKVMITHNLKMEGLANGLMARLLQVTREFLVLKRQDNNNKVYLERKPMTNGTQSWMQFPVVLAECITVHKSQGMTFDGIVLATGMMYKSAAGSFYTAVSRVRSLANTRIANVEKVKWSADVNAVEAMELTRRRSLRRSVLKF